MAMRVVTCCQSLIPGHQGNNRLIESRTMAVEVVTTCYGSYCSYERGNSLL